MYIVSMDLSMAQTQLILRGCTLGNRHTKTWHSLGNAIHRQAYNKHEGTIVCFEGAEMMPYNFGSSLRNLEQMKSTLTLWPSCLRHPSLQIAAPRNAKIVPHIARTQLRRVTIVILLTILSRDSHCTYTRRLIPLRDKQNPSLHPLATTESRLCWI